MGACMVPWLHSYTREPVNQLYYDKVSLDSNLQLGTGCGDVSNVIAFKLQLCLLYNS